MSNRYLFVGEKPSLRALQMGVRWEDGKLCAKQLFDALYFCGINPWEHSFINLWPDYITCVETFLAPMSKTHTIVAMGRKVAKELIKRGVPCLEIVHPAARGEIRKKEVYCNHVKEALGV